MRERLRALRTRAATHPLALTRALTLALTLPGSAFLAADAQAGTMSVLYSFNGANDGAYPESAPIVDARGDLFGTTYAGGANGCGTVWRLHKAKGAWKETILYSFACGEDGANPVGGVVMDARGNLYGGTSLGGTGDCSEGGTRVGCGAVYELARGRGGAWHQSVLYSWPAPNNGFQGPTASLTLDAKGRIYGTTAADSSCTHNFGSVFALKPVNDAWKERELHGFCRARDGTTPGYGALSMDGSGNLYGTTTGGGAGDYGVAFALMPSGGGWKFVKLHEFDESEGGDLLGGLVRDAAGNLYGSEYRGPEGFGSIFELTPNKDGGWAAQSLAVFGGTNGVGPWQSPVFGADGNLFGTTQRGGTTRYCGDCGVLYELSPNGGGAWRETVLYDFGSEKNFTDGATPIGGLVLGGDGSFYGTTYQGGAGGFGVVYRYLP